MGNLKLGYDMNNDGRIKIVEENQTKVAIFCVDSKVQYFEKNII
jgi:hypothetical protein